MTTNELYHYGVLGMKWGVRRYQNNDGSLTNAGRKHLAKSLKKDYKHNYESGRPFRTSDSYKKTVSDTVRKSITNDDKKRITEAKNKWLSKVKEASKAEDELFRLGKKYGTKFYNDELRKNPDLFDTPRSKEKFSDYSVYEYGYGEAKKHRPDLYKASKSADKYWDTYKEECRKVSDKILGEYGNTKLYECKYYSYSIRDSVGDIVSSMDSNNWKTK